MHHKDVEMRDISAKSSTLRTAKAQAFVSCQPATLEQIKANTLPKGEFRDFCKAAGFLGAKHTQLLIPHCHPVNIDGMSMDFEIINGVVEDNTYGLPEDAQGVLILSEAKSIGRTGIEMEVLTGISMAALTLYDLLKNIDKEVEVGYIKLLNKKGGKSDRVSFTKTETQCALIGCSQAVVDGDKTPDALIRASELLGQHNTAIRISTHVGEDVHALNDAIDEVLASELDIAFVIGGSSIGKRDLVRQVLENRMDGHAPAIVTAIEQYALERTPLAMVSNLTAGYIGNTMFVTLPGSQEGVEQALNAILPAVFKSKRMIER